MSSPHICDDKDLIELCPEVDLWLRPHSKLTITVTLPTLKTLDNSGQLMTISTWEVMDKLKKKIKPLKFKTLKVSKSNIEFIRFDAECDSQTNLTLIESRLNKISLKLSGFAQQLMVKTAKVKIGSTRHEWETYFRDNPHMNEMKPGYRPDTLHLQSLPVKWFGGERPSPNLLVKVFGTFGDIRRFHIPVLDVKEQDEGFKRFSFNESLSFEAFVQFRDYIGFVKAMDGLRGMKLVKKLSEIKNQKNHNLEYDINVDFDRTKHLSDKAIKKRRIAREYGITSAVELKKLRDETKKQRQRTMGRIDLLRNRKQTAKSILEYLLATAEVKAKAKKVVDEQKSAEQKIKDRLLLEEVKLREKLLERRREQLREQSKGKLKSVANLNSNNSNICVNSDSNQSNPINISQTNDSNVHSFKSYSFHSYRKRFGNYTNYTNNNNYVNYRRLLYLNHRNQPLHQPVIHTNYTNTTNTTNSSLYKNHKKSCKFYKPKSIVIPTNNSNKD